MNIQKNNIAFGNLTVNIRNDEHKATELHRALKGEGISVNSEHYWGNVNSRDNRLDKVKGSDTFTELRIKTDNTTQEKDILSRIHDWATENNINTRVDIDVDNDEIRREQKISYSDKFL